MCGAAVVVFVVSACVATAVPGFLDVLVAFNTVVAVETSWMLMMMLAVFVITIVDGVFAVFDSDVVGIVFFYLLMLLALWVLLLLPFCCHGS